MITKIISGGQTGADQAALDFAIQHGIPHGGWIPKGRKTEDGILPNKYHLQEMPTASYPKRTEKNILDSDGWDPDLFPRQAHWRICVDAEVFQEPPKATAAH